MERTTDPAGGAGNDRSLPTSKSGADDEGGERVEYGGGVQPGGGMVEPDEFDEAIGEPGLPNDALTEGPIGRPAAAPKAGTVDPAASPDQNDTGDRMGDVGGYLDSDRVVDTGVADSESAESDR